MVPFRSALVRLERVDGLHTVAMLRPDGSERSLAFDDPAYALALPAGQDYNAPQAMIVHQSPRSPRRWIRIDLERGTREEVRREAVAGCAEPKSPAWPLIGPYPRVVRHLGDAFRRR